VVFKFDFQVRVRGLSVFNGSSQNRSITHLGTSKDTIIATIYIKFNIKLNFLTQFQSKLEENLPEPQAIYLEGALGHDSQILVADSQIKEEVYDSELNGSAEEPAVCISI